MLRLRTLGGLAIERPEASQSSGTVTARRRLSLLAVLAASGRRGVPRDKLVALFWPESDNDRARHALEQSIYGLKRELHADNLVLGRDELSLNAEVISSDVGELREALKSGDRKLAVDIYSGPFLDGVFISGAPEFERWVDSERADISREVETALEWLASDATSRGDHREAVRCWQRLAAMDPRKTRVVVALMSELAAVGDRAGALRQAEVYRTLVRNELEAEPNPAVDALAERLRLVEGMSPLPGSAPLTTRTTLFGGRYRLEREVGQGTSATVFLAHDVPNDRPVAIKILRPELSAGVAVDRFRQEITVTANLQHPHILPVHDSGEADGALYFVMPYVDGESLRDRLRRAPERRLGVTEAVRLTTEIAGALAYAHGRGIVHRDIKPENVLITSGHAVVCDFGLARALGRASAARRTAPGLVVGTPAYLSPERARTGDEGDARSDQYSLACLLYEALAGEAPFAAANVDDSIRARVEETPRGLHTLNPQVPARVDRATARALSPDPAQRFPDIAEFALALTSDDRRSWRRYRWQTAAGFALLCGILGALSLLLRPSRLAERSFVVLADIENRTKEPVFDHAIDAAVAAGLQQSTRIELVPANRVQETLARMRRESSLSSSSSGSHPSRLNEDVAREIAQREGIRAVLAGSIDRIDSSYIVTERLVDAQSGRTLASESANAKARSAVIDAVDDLVRRMRRRIGESQRAISIHDRPLPQVTTRSLEALRKYADGLAAAHAGQSAESHEFFEQAIAIDSDFALAHAELGIQSYFGNDRVSGDKHFDRALSLLDRLTDRERLHVRAAVEDWRGQRERAIELRLALLREYPGDPKAWSSIGYDYMRLNRPREAVDALMRQIARDSTSAVDYVNLAEAYLELKDFNNSLASFRRAFRLQPSFKSQPGIREEYVRVLVFNGQTAAARTTLDTMLSGDPFSRARAERLRGFLEMREGHFDDAITHFRQAILLLAQQPGSALSIARNHLFLSAAQFQKGRLDSARAELRAAHALSRKNSFEPAFLMFLGKALVREGELKLAAEVLDSLRTHVRSTNPNDIANLQVLSSELALDPIGRRFASIPPNESAVDLLRRAFAVDSTPLVSESLARALSSIGNPLEAADRYERIADHLTEWFGWEAQPYAMASLLEAGRLHEGLGDTARAVSAYRTLVALLARGDSDLALVREARTGLLRLGKH